MKSDVRLNAVHCTHAVAEIAAHVYFSVSSFAEN